ncbi:MAG: sugar porter family MFS transporter [Bacteroidia bacterium]|nr:sugar porter family MFS transporter [Bacteroidia bacterium]
MNNRSYITLTALIVALGGFLMGFDASVISGVNDFIKQEFKLSDFQLGWAVASLTLVSSLAMLFAGPVSDHFGRKQVLRWAAVLYAISAVCSALAPNYTMLVIARMIGGLGVGASLIIAPIYIAEIAPPNLRGQMVSFNQLNIVVGISAAFFSNYFILKLGESDAAWVTNLGIKGNQWRWMLGLETVPAIMYFLGLFFVPRSPRWLAMKGEFDEALEVMRKAAGEKAEQIMTEVRAAINSGGEKNKGSAGDLFAKSMRLVLIIGVVVGVLQQITGINSVFFYAPMIFKQSGIGQDASFTQAIYVGLINLVFTILAIALIDSLGRKPLLSFGVAGIAIFMFLLAYGFNSATYQLSAEGIANLPAEVKTEQLLAMEGQSFDNDVQFKKAMKDTLGDEMAGKYESDLISAAINMNPWLILIGILGFVASFAFSIGPVMWVLFSELFPQKVRGIAISAVGLINSAVSFLVQLIFPWELANLGSSMTFLIYGIFAALGFLFIIFVIPETKGRSLEELEKILIKE